MHRNIMLTLKILTLFGLLFLGSGVIEAYSPPIYDIETTAQGINVDGNANTLQFGYIISIIFAILGFFSVTAVLFTLRNSSPTPTFKKSTFIALSSVFTIAILWISVFFAFLFYLQANHSHSIQVNDIYYSLFRSTFIYIITLGAYFVVLLFLGLIVKSIPAKKVTLYTSIGVLLTLSLTIATLFCADHWF